MEKPLHPNFIKSSNFIFITFVLGLINIVMIRNELTSAVPIASAIASILSVLGLGYLVRRGYDWMKYLLLALTAIGLLISVPVTIITLGQNQLVGLTNIVQTVLQVWATILLFRIPKTLQQETVESSTK